MPLFKRSRLCRDTPTHALCLQLLIVDHIVKFSDRVILHVKLTWLRYTGNQRNLPHSMNSIVVVRLVLQKPSTSTTYKPIPLSRTGVFSNHVCFWCWENNVSVWIKPRWTRKKYLVFVKPGKKRYLPCWISAVNSTTFASRVLNLEKWKRSTRLTNSWHQLTISLKS